MNAERQKRQQGFSYIDVMIATVILLVGVLACAAALTGAIVKTQEDEKQLIAKQYATAAIEAIFSARDVLGRNDPTAGDTPGLGFAAAQNTAAGGPGIFPGGKRSIYVDDGKDGIVGTTDDTWGPDGVAGNSDDITTTVPDFDREVKITNVNDANNDGKDDTTGLAVSLRTIDVIVYYRVQSIQRQLTLTTVIGDYRYLN